MATTSETDTGLTAPGFARAVILGPGGMEDYTTREWVIWHGDIRVHAAEWVLRCLANPRCEGSAEALAAILDCRAKGGAPLRAAVGDLRAATAGRLGEGT